VLNTASTIKIGRIERKGVAGAVDHHNIKNQILLKYAVKTELNLDTVVSQVDVFAAHLEMPFRCLGG